MTSAWEATMGSLWERLEELPDHRTLKGRRYSLAAIVGISLAAMLSGANDLMAIFRWGRRLTPKGLASFGIGRGPGNAPIALAHLRDCTLALSPLRDCPPPLSDVAAVNQNPPAKHSPPIPAPPSAPSSPHELNGPGSG